MKSRLSLLFVLLTLGTQAQQACDTIKVEKEFGKVYSYQKQKLKPKQMLELMEPNPMAYRAMKRAKANYDVGCVFGFAGGFIGLVNWQRRDRLAHSRRGSWFDRPIDTIFYRTRQAYQKSCKNV